MKRETTSAIICNTTEDFEMWSIIKKHKVVQNSFQMNVARDRIRPNIPA